MKQQVNLYQPIFRQRKPMFSARALAQTAVLLLVVLSGLYAYAAWEVARLEAHVRAMESQRQSAQQRLVMLQQDLPARAPSRLLATEVQRLVDEITGSESLVTLLSGPEGGVEGFSAHLEGLARQRVDGLWLTGIRLADAGRNVVIRGSALDAALVPLLVQRLGDELAFRGMRFAALSIDRAEDDSGRVDFVLRTHVEDEEAARGG